MGPRAPLPKTSLFTQQKYLILEWQQKNSAKTLHTTTTTYFFWQIQNKKLKISVEFKMVKSLNTRFLKKKNRFNIKFQHKKTSTFFHAKKKYKKRPIQFTCMQK